MATWRSQPPRLARTTGSASGTLAATVEHYGLEVKLGGNLEFKRFVRRPRAVMKMRIPARAGAWQTRARSNREVQLHRFGGWLDAPGTPFAELVLAFQTVDLI